MRYPGGVSRSPGVPLAVALLAVALGACGEDRSPAGEPTAQPGVVDLPGGGKRVKLIGDYVASIKGEGWNLATGLITPGPDDSDFHLSMTMVVMLFPTTAMNDFCFKQPAAGAAAFARVEDVPADEADCASWTSASLGGTFEHSETMWAGQGYLVRDRAGVTAAKLLTVADYVIGPDVGITFDIIAL